MSEITIELSNEAEAEFYDIVDYYKQYDQTLSYDFIQEFEDVVRRITKFPKAGHPYLHQTLRSFLDRFPYAIIYKIYRDHLIVIYAIMHLKRSPEYWKTRV